MGVPYRQRSAAPPSATPVLYDAALLSPRALADTYGAATPEADAAVGALAAAVGKLRGALGTLHGGRWAAVHVHPETSNALNPTRTAGARGSWLVACSDGLPERRGAPVLPPAATHV